MSSSTWCRQLPRKLCHVIIYCSTKELRPTRQAVGWESESEKIHCTSINCCRGRRGPTFSHCDFVEWRAGVTYSFVWVKIQGKAEIFVGVSSTQHWSYHAGLVAELLWLLARWYHWNLSEMRKIKDLRELQVLWLPYQTILMCRLLRVFWPRKLSFF